VGFFPVAIRSLSSAESFNIGWCICRYSYSSCIQLCAVWDKVLCRSKLQALFWNWDCTMQVGLLANVKRVGNASLNFPSSVQTSFQKAVILPELAVHLVVPWTSVIWLIMDFQKGFLFSCPQVVSCTHFSPARLFFLSFPQAVVWNPQKELGREDSHLVDRFRADVWGRVVWGHVTCGW
jgi:hypothetical protein